MRLVAPVLLTLSVGIGVQFLAAQNSSQADQIPVIRATAGEVLLDMVVRDKHHHLVTDLRPEEVEVYEDGVRQDVKHFSLIHGAEQLQNEREDTQAKVPDQSGPLAPQGPKEKLRQLNFVSVVFAATAPLNREFAREAVLDFLKSDSLPNTFVTIYSMGHGLFVVQPYTANKTVLTAAVDRVAGRSTAPSGLDSATSTAGSAVATTVGNAVSVANATTQPTSVVDPMAQQFAGAIVSDPLWARDTASHDASTNLGAALDAQALLSLATRFDSTEGMQTLDALKLLVRSQEKLPGRKVVIYLADGLAFPYNREDAVSGLISLANRSGVTFYTVDTRGLSAESSLASGLASLETTGADSKQRGSVTGPTASHREMDDIGTTVVANRQLNMQVLAESTGGFAVSNTNQIAEPMQRVLEDIRTHYELSYSPKSTVYDGHFRKIEVKLVRQKLTVQTRRGYYALPMLNGKALQPFEAAALDKINTRPVPADFSYNASLMKFGANEKLVEYMIAFEVPVSGLNAVAVPKTDQARVRASLIALVRDSASGEVVEKMSREVWRDVPNQAVAQNSAGHIFYTQPLVLPHGSYTVDTVVTDEQSGKASVRRLAVPRDSGSGLRLSSLQVVGRAEPLAGERNPLNPFELDNVRIVPELADKVSSSGPVTLYFVLYPAKDKAGASANANVTLQILRDGTQISREPLKVPGPRPDGSIPMVVRVSPGHGSYALIVTAQQGKLVAESSRSLDIQ